MANPIYVTCNGTDISNSVDWKSIDIVNVLTKENGSCKFNVNLGSGQSGITVPAIGDVIEVYDSTGIIFGGTVTEVEATIQGLYMMNAVTVSDWGYLFDGTLVKKNYSGVDPHDIVVDLVTNFCGGKGFTTNHVQYGNFTVPTIQFNYQQPTKCLQSLANLIGWDWYIDANKDVHFFLGDVDNAVGDAGPAPITIDATSAEIQWNSLDVDLNLQNMQNSVYVIGGSRITMFTSSDTLDSYKTDGVQQSFPTSYAYTTSTIQVTLGGVAQTVGILNQVTDPTTVDVIYAPTDRNIQFTHGAPSSGQTVLIWGWADIPIIAHASDDSAIASYGEYQGVIVDSKITSVPEAQARATAQILLFGHPVYDVKVNTLIAGCRLGQAITVNLPAFGISKQLVIKRIESIGYVPGANGRLQYKLECIGSDKVTFVDLMSTILQQETSQSLTDSSTIIEELLSVEETVNVADAVELAHEARPYVWG